MKEIIIKIFAILGVATTGTVLWASLIELYREIKNKYDKYKCSKVQPCSFTNCKKNKHNHCFADPDYCHYHYLNTKFNNCAHWLENNDGSELILTCDNCGYCYIEADTDCEERHKYCPCCGSIMNKK